MLTGENNFFYNSHLSCAKILKTDHKRSYLMQKDNLFLLNERYINDLLITFDISSFI